MLPKEIGAARTARRAVEGWLADAPPQTRADALSVVTELVANAVEHGRPPIWVRLERQSTHWMLNVADAGDVDRRRGGRFPATGWGFRIVDLLAESWGVEDDGSRVWCHLPMAEAHAPKRD